MLKLLSFLLITILILPACGGTLAPTPIPPTPVPPTPAPVQEANDDMNEQADTDAGENMADDAQTNDDEGSDKEDSVAGMSEEMDDTATGSLSGLHTYTIVSSASNAAYLVDEEFFAGALAKLGIEAGLADVVGRTQEFEGQFSINFDDLTALEGTNRFVVKLNTLTTDQSRRDNWIRTNGPQFDAYPLAEFIATELEGSPESYSEGEEVQFKLKGDLTIREVTQPVTFDVSATVEGDTVIGVAMADLKMTDFDIEPPNFANTLSVANQFQVRVEFTAQEQ
jgi:polyisoprenoid-binding protein YceI